jgi:hypothetical protein
MCQHACLCRQAGLNIIPYIKEINQLEVGKRRCWQPCQAFIVTAAFPNPQRGLFFITRNFYNYLSPTGIADRLID